jgi:hypothetical protein
VGVAPAILYITGLMMWWNRSILPMLRRRRRLRKMRSEATLDPAGTLVQ